MIPPAERGDMMPAYYRRLTSSDRAELERAAKAWSIWEGATSFLRLNPDYVRSSATPASPRRSRASSATTS